jgi:D-alanyl-D-alanine carboxypeptidase
MRRYRYPIFFFALAASAAQASRGAAADLRRCMAFAAEREGLSGSILISRGDHIVANIFRGRLADPASAAIGPTTRFNLGSVSKMFTAVAIGQLIDAGKLRPDQPVGEVVGGLSPEAARVTFRQLLTHSSGLGDFFRPENMEAMMRARSAADILPLIAADKPAFPPGSRFAYSNSGFALLGIAIERVTHLTYGEYLRRNVFRPAGMSSTGLDPRPLATLAVGMTAGGMGPGGPGAGLMLVGPDGKRISPGGAALGPGPSETPRLIGPDGRRAGALRPAPGVTQGYGSPAGGLFSTAEDLRRFATALIANKLLSSATTSAFTSPQIDAGPAIDGRPRRQYGFGFSITDEAGKRWVGHNGGTLGANAEFAIQPDDQWTISVLSNRDPPVASNLMRQARSLIADPSRMATCE